MISFFRKKSKQEENKTPPAGNVSVRKPVFDSESVDFQFDLTGANGEKYSVLLNGYSVYYPNTSNASGYGSDDWFFGGVCDGKDFILLFSADSSSGAYWSGAFVDNRCADELKSEFNVWWTAYAKGSRVVCLHPCSIADAKRVVKAEYCRMGKLSDSDFYGN